MNYFKENKHFFKYYGFLFLAVLVSATTSSHAADDGSHISKVIMEYSALLENADKDSCYLENRQPCETASSECIVILEALDRLYDAISFELKQHPEMKQLRKKHLKLHSSLIDADERKALEKAIRSYRHRIRSLEKNHCIEGKYSRIESCEKYLQYAEDIYAGIFSIDKTDSRVEELKGRYDVLVRIHLENLAGKKRKQENAKRLRGLKKQYQNELSQIRHQLAVLKRGKNNRPIMPEIKIRELDDAIPAIKSFAESCKEIFSEIPDDPDIRDKCELAANCLRYRNQLVIATYKAFLDKSIEELSIAIQGLDENKTIETAHLDLLLHRFDSTCQAIVKRVSAAYASAGYPPPSFSDLKSLKARFESVLPEACTANRWDKKEMRPVTEVLAGLSVKKAAELGLELLDIGQSSAEWQIIKNKSGYPLQMVNSGFALLKHPEEPFARMYRIKFTRIFDGINYDSISTIDISTILRPVNFRQ